MTVRLFLAVPTVLLAAALPAVPSASPAPRRPLPSIAFSPDGRLLAAGGYGEVALLDSRTGKREATLAGPAGAVTCVAFSPDGKRLAASGGEPSRSGEIRVWEMASKSGRTLPKGHSDVVYSVAWSPDGKRLAAGSYDRMVSVWALSGGAPRMLKDHTDAVYSVAWSPDGSRVASASGDRTVKVWDPDSGRRIFTLSDSTAELYSVAFGPSSPPLRGEGVEAKRWQLAAAGVDRSLRKWAVTPSAGALVRSAFAHDRPILRVLYSPEGSVLYTSGEDGAVKEWDAETLVEKRVYEPQPDWALGLALDREGRRLAVSRYDGTAALYDTATGRRLFLMRTPD